MTPLDPTLLKKIQTQSRLVSPKISESLAQEALNILKNPPRLNEVGLFHVLCSANLLNVVVKQSEDKTWQDAYYFKADLVDCLLKLDPKFGFYRLAIEKDALLIECFQLQFSFHAVDLKRLKAHFDLVEGTWNQIKLQPYAQELYEASKFLVYPQLQIIDQLKALSDPIRYRIMELLQKEERCACTLLDELPISQSTLSHHLSVLTKAQLLTYRKEGLRVLYQIQAQSTQSLAQHLSALNSSHHID